MWDHRKLGDDPTYTGVDISTKSIVCKTLDENGSIVRKDNLENSFEKLREFLDSFLSGDNFVMESTGFYEPLYDFIESKGFSVKLANPLKIKLIAESRMKNDDVNSELLAKLLRNDMTGYRNRMFHQRRSGKSAGSSGQ